MMDWVVSDVTAINSCWIKKQIEAEPEGPTKNLNPNALQAVKIDDIYFMKIIFLGSAHNVQHWFP